MNRCIKRDYLFSQRDIREILVEWMKQKDLQRPMYVGDTDTTCWSDDGAGGIRVEWTDEDQIDIETGKPQP